MACFLVPAAEAVVVTAVAYGLKAKEKKAATLERSAASDVAEAVEEVKVALSTKLMWLSYLLWGGCLLLCFEHVWHGEVVPWFPFLTAAAAPADAAVMLEEMRAVGGVMAIEVTVVWVLVVLAVNHILKKKTPVAAAA